jgi:hypothetical protein
MMPPEQTERPRLRDGVHYVPTTFETRLRMMLIWEARQQARQAVIRKLKAEGRVPVSLLPRVEITRLAEAHLREHAAELLAQAEASGAVQKLRVAHERRAVEAQGKSLNETLVQNGDQQ